ncbi:hypothetical protein IV203_028026 [Nitzschia inconspicua]|uniref:Uncharacterized protein n=1 Tax=Nitzschia inconspicua TaxID=303405 RepID=A0A9K3LXH3_9STRA|nr:hypothetical protein IV203_028026 [Nitzschia inconspicua]
MPTETTADERKQDDYRTSPEGDPTRSGDVGGEGSSRSSTQQATTTTSTMVVNMTNAAPSPNGNRPPSTTSVHSTGSTTNGQQQQHPPRTTAMSRRGGRARSRSPSSMTMNRPPSTTPSEGSQHQPQHQQGGGQSSSTQGGPSSSNPPPPMSPANPSAAAAAAAAAAKSLHRSNGHGAGMGGPSSNSNHYPPSSFYGSASGGPPLPDDRSRYGRGHPSQHHHQHHHQHSSHHSRYGASGGGGPPPPPHLRAAPGYYDPYSHGGPPPPPTHHHQHPHHRGSSSSSSGWPTSSSGAAGPPTSKTPLGGSSSSSGNAMRQRDDPYGYNMYGARGGPPTGTGASSRDPYYHHRYAGNGTGPDDRGEYSRRGPPPPHYSSSSTHHPHYSRGGGPPLGIRPPGSGRSTSPHPPPSSYRQGPGNQDPYGYTGQSKDSPNDKNDPSAKSTKTVIGTATPIHVPRASERPSSQPPSAGSRQGSAASVFRGRPGSDLLRSKHSSNSASRGGGDDDDESSSPQKILLALRTPSHSFEEKKSGRVDDSNTSPEDPPQLRSNTADNNLFFDPQRSPKSDVSGPPQPTNSLDMAPSFSLFNQSFDSLGDTAHFFNVGGPLDSALQSASFGGTASILEDKMGIGDLQLTASNGTFKLNASSSGGAMTFGMSPTNSFGNGPTSSFTTRGGNITLLGNDHRAASPSQVLEIGYQSGATSPHSKRGGSMDEGNLRLSASMGSPTYSRQYVGDGGQGHYQHSSSSSHHPFGHPYQGASYPTHRPYRGSTTPAPDGAPHFYIFLRKHKEAFREVTFLLPGLKCVMGSSKSNKKEDKDETPKRQGRDRRAPSEPNEQEIEISQRRIASAVCAFGGTYIGSRMKPENAQKKAAKQSIFRAKSDSPQSADGPKVSRQRAKYDDALPGRYYENDNRLSWEFEENPPIGNFDDDDDDDDEYDSNGNRKMGNGSKHGGSSNNKNKLDGENDDDDDDDDDDGSGEENEDGTKRDKDKPKMRYRCKLCGQPKQNHTCPYQQSLARSIGIMVYPAVNAFTSAEPGVLAPALSEMNNFVGSGGDSVSSGEGSPSRPTPDRMRRLNPSGSIVGGPSTAQVTPESMRGTPRSPGNFLTPQRIGARTPSIGRRSGSSIPSSARSKKRSHGQMHGGSVGGEVGTQDDLLFVEPMDLKPEQFRMVTPSKALTHNDAFTYPALPLPYAQRKRLSDNLFSLSKEVPQLTDECAAVLREARERDLWDLAVAELMTQVVVVVHCHDGDMCFEGLRRYLLSLGISC